MKLYENLHNLMDYSPKDNFVTSAEEIEYIKKTLKLDECDSDDIYNYRTIVVLLWGNRAMEARKNEDFDEHDKLWNAMMSITAVLDSIR